MAADTNHFANPKRITEGILIAIITAAIVASISSFATGIKTSTILERVVAIQLRVVERLDVMDVRVGKAEETMAVHAARQEAYEAATREIREKNIKRLQMIDKRISSDEAKPPPAVVYRDGVKQ